MNALLEVRDLYKHFDGLVATDHLNLCVEEGSLHALIGPNGAGKTTLIGQLAGSLRPDGGQILFSGRDVTRLTTHQRVRQGLARSFQITSIFKRYTVAENLALAVQARTGSSLSFWRPVASEQRLVDESARIAEEVGLGARLGVRAGELAHGEQRQLEVGLAVATQARLLLLDEPMAGMGGEESHDMVARLRHLKGHHAMLLIEHDMDAVFALADRITVLVYGRAIATGTPQEIRANAEVRQAYLGESDTP